VSRLRDRLPWSEPRILALLGVALALGAPLRTMYHLIDVVGSPTQFLVVAGVAFVLAVLLARVVHPALAIGLGVGLFGLGVAWYMANLGTDPETAQLVDDTVKLLTGRRLLQIAKVSLWVTSFVAAPVFLTTYFALRRWYVTAVLMSGLTLSFFVLTTDATVITTLLGVVGSVAAVGFGRLDTVTETAGSETGTDSGAADAGIDSGRRSVLEQLAAIIVAPVVLSRVPGVNGSAVSVLDGGSETVESSLVTAGDSLTVQGSISLSPALRYTVESDDPRYWRVAAYDRYTGDGWVRTGDARPYDETDIDEPLGRTRQLEQRFEAESAIGTVPAAWKPTAYDGDPDVELTGHGGLQPVDGVAEGDSYVVESAVPDVSAEQLRDADGGFPGSVTDLHLQLPESTPDRVEETTGTLTENAETPYEHALVVEQWLESNKEYSLEVERPDRSVADRFLHAMNAGYCTYFATTMAVMLRTQGIPARLAVGYTPGEPVGPNRREVRGLHSHAWVEVYVPDYGWTQFDPTPAGPREDAEQNADEESDDAGTDASETPTESSTPTPEGTPAETPTATPEPTDTEAGTPGDDSGPDAPGTGGIDLPDAPSREETTLGLVALLGTAAGLRRAGVTDRLSRAVWLRYQRPERPEEDIERAFQRAMYVLGQQHRQRESGETVRAYLDAVDADDDIRRLAALRERLRYEGDVSADAAREAIEIADDVVARK